MKRSLVPSLPEYEEVIYEEDQIKEAAKKLKAKRKLLTSVALEEKTVKELQKIVNKKGFIIRF